MAPPGPIPDAATAFMERERLPLAPSDPAPNPHETLFRSPAMPIDGLTRRGTDCEALTCRPLPSPRPSEKRGHKVPVTDAFSKMGGAFRHLGSPDFGWLAQQVQQEVDRRWERLKALAGHALL